MDYLVTALDGKEYGPVTDDQLREWVQQDRVRPGTPLKNFHTGQVLSAQDVPGLFAPTAPPPPAAYPRNYSPAHAAAVDNGGGVLVGVAIRSAAGVALFFLLHGIGLIFTGYALFYAIQSLSKGHKLGIVSVAIAAVAFVAVLIGWIIRLKGGGSM